jgi:site-specific recombinase XerD
VHAHAFRHTFATNMAEGGMPLDTLKRVLGHRHLESVAVYNQVRDGRAHREYRQVMAAISGAACGRDAPGAQAVHGPQGVRP